MKEVCRAGCSFVLFCFCRKQRNTLPLEEVLALWLVLHSLHKAHILSNGLRGACELNAWSLWQKGWQSLRCARHCPQELQGTFPPTEVCLLSKLTTADAAHLLLWVSFFYIFWCFETQFHSVAKASLLLTMLLRLPPTLNSKQSPCLSLPRMTGR